MPYSLICSFKEKFGKVDFNEKFEGLDTNDMTVSLENVTTELFEQTFPMKKIITYTEDKPWFNEELRALKRKRLREYTRHGKSEKYSRLSNNFNEKVKEAVSKHMEKVRNEVADGKRGSAYPVLRKLAQHPDTSSSQFMLPSHSDRDLTPVESAEILANHFSRISCEYRPLEISELPPNIQTHLNTPDFDDAPVLSLTSVYLRIIKAKKPNSIVHGDLPKKLVKECATELAKPSQIIFNSITHSSTYPTKCKTEHQIPIPKIQAPQSEEDLRNIAETPLT